MLVKFVILLLKEFGLFTILLCILEQVEECSFSVITLIQFSFQLLTCNLVQFVMIIQLIKVVDQLLVVFRSHVSFHFLHIFNFVFVTTHLLLHFLENLVTGLIPLLDIVVPSEEFLGLVAHALM